MLLCEKGTICDLEIGDLENLTYQEIPESELWRIDLVNELLCIRGNDLELNGFSMEEINDLIEYVCVSWVICT